MTTEPSGSVGKGVEKMNASSLSLSRILLFALGIVLVCAAWSLLAFWQSNKISVQFQTLSRTAYRSVRDCYDKVGVEDPSVPNCLNHAQDMVFRVGQLARTQHERREYADLHGFLIQVDQYHQKRLSSDLNEAHQNEEDLNKFRARLDEVFK